MKNVAPVPGRNVKDYIPLCAILFFYSVLILPFLTTFPPIDYVGDESWMMNISLELLRTGKPLSTMHAGTPIAETITIITKWIYNGALSGILALFGVSVWAGRFLSYLSGLAVVIITFYFGKALVNRQVGLVASFILATSYAFSWHSREIRPEMMLMAFTTFSVYLFYLAQTRKKNSFFFISGLTVTLSVQAHPNGALFAFSIVIIYVFMNRKNLFSRPSLYLFLGLLTGFSLWFAGNYMTGSMQNFEALDKKYLPPILNENFFSLLKKSIIPFSVNTFDLIKNNTYRNISLNLIYPALLFILAALVKGKNRGKLLFLLSFIWLPMVVSHFIMGTWAWFHYSVFLPLGVLLLAVSLHDISGLVARPHPKRFVFWGATAIFACIGITDIMANNLDMMKYDFRKMEANISDSVPHGVTVMGSPLYYFAFLDGATRFTTYVFVEERCPDFEAEARKNHVDYILLDSTMMNLVSLWCSPYYAKSEVLYFLTEKASLQKVIRVEYPSGFALNKPARNLYVFKMHR